MKTAITFILCLALFKLDAQVNIDSLKNVALDSKQISKERFLAYYEISTYYTSSLSDSLKFFGDNWEVLARSEGNFQEVVNAKICLGRHYYFQGRDDISVMLFDEAFEIADSIGFKGGMSKVQMSKGSVLSTYGRLAEAKVCLDGGLRIAEDLEDSVLIGESLRALGNFYYQQVKFDSALYYFQGSVDIYKSLGMKSGMAMPMERIGEIYVNQGRTQEAIRIYEEAVLFWQAENNALRVAFAYDHLGNVYEKRGVLDKAIEFYSRSLDLYKGIDYGQGEMGALFRLATIHISAGDSARGENFFKMAHEATLKTGDQYFIGAFLANVGETYRYKGMYELAQQYLDSALVYFKKEGRAMEMSQTYVNLGHLYEQQDQLDKAIEHYGYAMELGEDLGCQFCIALSGTNLAGVWGKLGDDDKIINYGEKGFEAAKIINDISMAGEAAKYLNRAYKRKGQYRKALAKYEYSIKVRDSLTSLANQRATIQYEYEKQALADSLIFAQEKERSDLSFQTKINKQNLFLAFAVSLGVILASLAVLLIFSIRRRKRTNFILSNQKEEIEQKNAQNELLLKEIHHRVKNNLEVVSSLLELQSAQLEDDAMRSTMLQSQSRVQSMGIIHQKLYQGANLSSIEMKEYFQNLGEYLLDAFDAHERINIQVDMESLDLDIDTAVPIGLIVNELLTNSLKYAFPEGRVGKIEISLMPMSDQKLFLNVFDDGIGKKRGMPAQGSGFGGQLIHLLTRQLNGSIHESNAEGTQFSFELERVKT
ncbi:MAG: tetratricopeptide repeat protein [Bacteroidia bacterium]|nr:tetratricopeptide repeat protein [Bacteroidia bacterium]